MLVIGFIIIIVLLALVYININFMNRANNTHQIFDEDITKLNNNDNITGNMDSYTIGGDTYEDTDNDIYSEENLLKVGDMLKLYDMNQNKFYNAYGTKVENDKDYNISNDKLYIPLINDIMTDLENITMGEVYKSRDENNQLYHIIQDPMSRYKLMNMFSTIMDTTVDKIEDLINSIDSTTIDDEFIDKIRPNILERNFDKSLELFETNISQYVHIFDYDVMEVLLSNILIISKSDFYKALINEYNISDIAHWNPLETEPPNNKYDIIYVFELEFHMDLYDHIINLSDDNCLFISTYFSASNDYDVMISDIYQKIYNIPKQSSLHFYLSESLRNKYIPNMKFVHGKQATIEEYTYYPISILFIGYISNNIYPKKINTKNIKKFEIEDKFTNMDLGEIFTYIKSDPFIYSAFSMQLYDMCRIESKEVETLDDIHNKVKPHYLKDLRKYMIHISNLLDKDMPDYKALLKPFNRERDNKIIYYMDFDEDAILNINDKKGQKILYNIDYKIKGPYSFMMAKLYYHIMGFKYDKKMSKYTDTLEDMSPNIKMTSKHMFNMYMTTKYVQNNVYLSISMYHDKKTGIDSFPDSHGLAHVYLEDRYVFDNYLMKYIKRVEINDKNIRYIKLLASMNNNDAEILEYIASNVPEPPKQSYTKYAFIKSKQIKKTLRQFNAKGHIGSYLDIGAIDDKQIEIIAESFNIPQNKAYGINVDDEEEGHLDYNYEATKDKIVIYDGKNIPVINGNVSYDLISIFSVLHHIPQNILEELAKSIYQRCGKFLVIKDNNIIDKKTETYVLWQHYIYNRNISLEGYTRTDLTLQKVIDLFEGVGFKYVGADLQENFVRRYFALFVKL